MIGIESMEKGIFQQMYISLLNFLYFMVLVW